MYQLQILCTSASTIGEIHAALGYPPEAAINRKLSSEYLTEVTSPWLIHFHHHFHSLSVVVVQLHIDGFGLGQP
jgi:hypothetical protein